MSNERRASIDRSTKETQIAVELNLDGTGGAEFDIGVPFLEHMLDQVARHGMFDLAVQAKGDLENRPRTTPLRTSVSPWDRPSGRRWGTSAGSAVTGMLMCPWTKRCRGVVLDFSGRPGLDYHVEYPRARVGEFDVDLLREFFQGFVNHAMVTLHIDNIRGRNTHHIAETIFKAFGRSLRVAVERDPRMEGILPSTKGSL